MKSGRSGAAAAAAAHSEASILRRIETNWLARPKKPSLASHLGRVSSILIPLARPPTPAGPAETAGAETVAKVRAGLS